MSRFRVPVLCAAWLLAARLPGQDLTIVSKTAFGNTEGTSTHFITSHRSRSSSREDDSIVSFADGKVTFVDHRRKEYWEATAEEMEDHWERTARKLRTSGAGDLWDLRAEPRLEKLPGKRKFAGYDCERWSLSIGDALEVDFWAAPGLAAPARYYDGRRLAVVALGPMGGLFQKMYEEMKKVKAFPLSTAVIFRTPVFRTETLEEVTEIRKGPIPPSAFDVPTGYKKVRSPLER